ncbi:MAG TPA: glycosyltransferase family 39 protein [Pyrinomonadaceae bacterium]|nr:glycosyltransferase family 39 protein [Pyrinomonadaceae bacterium]
MPPLFDGQDLSRRGAAVALAVLVAAGAALYAAGVPDNPPGFFIDESSIAYNAYLVAGTGRDEHGEFLPLFFRAFHEYKNPVYVYLLAAVFKVTGPSIAAARLLSAALGVAAALALGLLGARVSGRRDVGVSVALSALLTPWLFELSRVALEVALYPLAVTLALLAVRRAWSRGRWSWADAALVAVALALVTYAYSTGRLFAPLLALGLLIFARRAGLASVARAWLLYALALAPLAVFHLRNPGALTRRFELITYIKPESTWAEVAWGFAAHYFGNFNLWWMLVTGDPKNQIVSVRGMGQVLLPTFALAAAGAWLVLRRGRRDPWWVFVLYATAASVVPASLTKEYFHVLRLAALPVFVVALTIPAFAYLAEGAGRDRRRRALLVAAVVFTLAQGAAFQWHFRARGRTPQRMHEFDADYPSKVLRAALAAAGPRPVYLADTRSVPGYIQAYWYATIGGIPLERFVRLGPAATAPAGEVVITTESTCPRCRVISEVEPYTVYVAEGPPRPELRPLPEAGFRASVRLAGPPPVLRAGRPAELRAVVRNEGAALWRARERDGEPYQLSLGNHWLDPAGRTLVNDDGRTQLPRDTAPGEEVELTLHVNAPNAPGHYLLELDMLQEGVTWFGNKGSPTLRLPVRVE